MEDTRRLYRGNGWWLQGRCYANRGQIRRADKGPFSAAANVDQDIACVIAKPCPNLARRNIGLVTTSRHRNQQTSLSRTRTSFITHHEYPAYRPG